MALDAITNVKVTNKVTWEANKTVTGFAPIKNNGTLERLKSFSLGTGANQINEIISFIQTVSASGSSDIDLSAALTNVVGDASVTLARIKYLLIELLSATDLGDDGTTVIGNACSDITVGGAASNPWLGPLDDASDEINILNGDYWEASRTDATGWVVTASSADTLKIANNDGAVDAKVRITIFGAAS